MKIQLSDHFTYGRLLRFTLPSMFMMIFTSIYGVVDGFFVSNYVGATPFAALNLIIPFIMIFSAIGFMLGSGGSALVAVNLGMGKEKRAKEIFSMILFVVIVLGVVFTIVGISATPKMAVLLGASEEMLPYCIIYGRVCFLGLVPFMLQSCFQTFMITAEKPQLGLLFIVAAGVTNMVLDALFMGVFGWGLWSAAAATSIGYCVGGFLPLLYFIAPNSSKLHMCKTKLYKKELFQAASNGSSEFLSNVSLSVVTMLYNYQLMRFAGQNGVSAYGIIMYTNFIFVGTFLGYSMGSSPVASYHLGAGNTKELKNIFTKSIRLISIAGIAMTLISFFAARPMAYIFASYDAELLDMTTDAIRIYAFSFLFMGFNLYGSAFFTAMNNGPVSALISFMRTMVFEVLAVLCLPMLLGLHGIWGAVIVAELGALVITVSCFVKNRKRYHYM